MLHVYTQNVKLVCLEREREREREREAISWGVAALSIDISESEWERGQEIIGLKSAMFSVHSCCMRCSCSCCRCRRSRSRRRFPVCATRKPRKLIRKGFNNLLLGSDVPKVIQFFDLPRLGCDGMIKFVMYQGVQAGHAATNQMMALRITSNREY